MDPSCLHVDMHIDFFANFLFKENINNAIIKLTLEEIKNNKDLFFFLVDLLCKGLVMLFGNNNKVELESLSIDNFQIIKQKMSLAGINVLLDLQPNNANLEYAKLNLEEIENTKPDNLDLKLYHFTIENNIFIYTISFELFHNV
jgi:hypothetical protein